MMDLGKFMKLEWNPQISKHIQVKFALIMVEEMIEGIDFQFVELNLTWKIKFCVLIESLELNLTWNIEFSNFQMNLVKYDKLTTKNILILRSMA